MVRESINTVKEELKASLILPYVKLYFRISPTEEELFSVTLAEDRSTCEVRLSLKEVIEDIEGGIAYGLIADHILPAKGDVAHIKELILQSWIKEELKILHEEYEDLFYELFIDPSYFIMSHYLRKGKVLFMFKQHYRHLASTALEQLEREQVMWRVLRKMERDGYVIIKDSKVRPLRDITRELGEIKKRSMIPIKGFLKAPMGLSIFSLLIRLIKVPTIGEENGIWSYPIWVETDAGLKPLKAEEEVKTGVISDGARLRRLGGMINTAYLATWENGENRVIKVFKEWTDLKWLPLAFWALGAYTFDPTGKGRLINEFTMNRKFKRAGIRVPEIYHIDLSKKIIVEQFVPGLTLKDVIVNILKGKYHVEAVEHIRSALHELSIVHEKGFVIGDANPTNVIINDKSVFFVDLEQAREGDKFSWDLATMMFFLAHYVQGSARNLDMIIKAMVEGYTERGDVEVIKKALRIPYLRVYAFFAYPHAIYKVYKLVSKYAGGIEIR